MNRLGRYNGSTPVRSESVQTLYISVAAVLGISPVIENTAGLPLATMNFRPFTKANNHEAQQNG